MTFRSGNRDGVVSITQAGGGLGAALSLHAWAEYVLEHASAQSAVIASGATVVHTTSRIVDIPRVSGNGGTAWHAGLDSVGPGDPTGEELVLRPRNCDAISKLSHESVNDSSSSALDAVGTAISRAIGLEGMASFAGSGVVNDQATGIGTLAGMPKHVVRSVTRASSRRRIWRGAVTRTRSIATRPT